MPTKRRRIIEDDDDDDSAGPSGSPELDGAHTPSGASSSLSPPPISPPPGSSKKSDVPKQSIKLKLKVPVAAADDSTSPSPNPDAAPSRENGKGNEKRPRKGKRDSIVSQRTMTTRSQSPEKQGSRAESPVKVTLSVNAGESSAALEPAAGPSTDASKDEHKAKGKGKAKGSGDAGPVQTPAKAEGAGRPEGKSKSSKKKRRDTAVDKQEGDGQKVDEDVDLFGDPTDDVPRDPSPPGASAPKDGGKASKKKTKEIPPSTSSTDLSSSGKGTLPEQVKKRRLSGDLARGSPLARPPNPSPIIPAASTPGPSASTSAAAERPVGISTDPKKPAAAVQPKKSLPNLKKMKLPGAGASATPSRVGGTGGGTSLLSSTLASLTKAPSTAAVGAGKKDDKKATTAPTPQPKKRGGWDEEWVLTPKEEEQYTASLPQREREKVERAKWRINAINLQEGKDAYRLEGTQPRAITIAHTDKHPDPHGLITTGATNRMISALMAGNR